MYWYMTSLPITSSLSRIPGMSGQAERSVFLCAWPHDGVQCCRVPKNEGREERGVQCRSLVPFLNFSFPADLRTYMRSKRHASMQYKVQDLHISSSIIRTVLIFKFLSWRVHKKCRNSSLAVLRQHIRRHLTVRVLPAQLKKTGAEVYTTPGSRSLVGQYPDDTCPHRSAARAGFAKVLPLVLTRTPSAFYTSFFFFARSIQIISTSGVYY